MLVSMLQQRSLDSLFAPGSVAVVGASRDPAKWGGVLARKALDGVHRRTVRLVNRGGGEILGEPAYTSVAELPEPPELVVACVPAGEFDATVDEALAAGARAIVGITGGVHGREAGERARAAGAVLLGPNCLGVFDRDAELDLAAWAEFPAGDIGLIAQSGNLSLELGLLAAGEGLGFSRFASLGNQADVDAAELLDDFARHDASRLVALYVEDFRDGRAFARAARDAGKPVVLLTAGASDAGARAARSHTGALVSDPTCVDAARACRRREGASSRPTPPRPARCGARRRRRPRRRRRGSRDAGGARPADGGGLARESRRPCRRGRARRDDVRARRPRTPRLRRDRRAARHRLLRWLRDRGGTPYGSGARRCARCAAHDVPRVGRSPRAPARQPRDRVRGTRARRIAGARDSRDRGARQRRRACAGRLLLCARPGRRRGRADGGGAAGRVAGGCGRRSRRARLPGRAEVACVRAQVSRGRRRRRDRRRGRAACAVRRARVGRAHGGRGARADRRHAARCSLRPALARRPRRRSYGSAERRRDHACARRAARGRANAALAPLRAAARRSRSCCAGRLGAVAPRSACAVARRARGEPAPRHCGRRRRPRRPHRPRRHDSGPMTDVETTTGLRTIQSVDRAAALLKAVANSQQPLTVVELASQCGLNRSTAWRLLATLDSQGLVERDPMTQRYSVGHAIFQIAAAGDHDAFVRLAHPVLQRLANDTGETVNLAVAKRFDLVYVHQVEAPQIMAPNWLGRGVALHATSSGKAFLAWLPEEERNVLVAQRLERFTDTTITERSKLEEELEQV